MWPFAVQPRRQIPVTWPPAPRDICSTFGLHLAGRCRPNGGVALQPVYGRKDPRNLDHHEQPPKLQKLPRPQITYDRRARVVFEHTKHDFINDYVAFLAHQTAAGNAVEKTEWEQGEENLSAGREYHPDLSVLGGRLSIGPIWVSMQDPYCLGKPSSRRFSPTQLIAFFLIHRQSAIHKPHADSATTGGESPDARTASYGLPAFEAFKVQTVALRETAQRLKSEIERMIAADEGRIPSSDKILRKF
ncbi:hypothetical protein C8F04DRAFT_1183691 [Mycena alexandri]|uniref:Uncharacterized protein n=1 Tax=Mycena alexandri TaxID=1745969 RepID=A0AAD6X6G6_9AGAR|nr:hypothetical protein C8F04DRAFT_1183691 [Mycena alexandri]